MTSASNQTPITLDQLAKNSRAIITHVDTRSEGAEVSLRLMELGFVAGETVKVMAKGFFANAPMAVRVGGTTFALRKFEAALISVSLLEVLATSITAPHAEHAGAEVT